MYWENSNILNLAQKLIVMYVETKKNFTKMAIVKILQRKRKGMERQRGAIGWPRLDKDCLRTRAKERIQEAMDETAIEILESWK